MNASVLLRGARLADTFVGGATLGVAAATAGLLVAAIWAGKKAADGVNKQIDEQRLIDERHITSQQAIERRHRVLDHQAVLSSRDFVEMSAPGIELFRKFREDSRKAQADWLAMSVLQQMTVLAVLNYYELVAGEYNADALDRQTAQVSLAYAAIVMWEYAAPFIDHLRRSDPTYFAEWKYMYETYGVKILARARQGPSGADGASGEHPSAAALMLHRPGPIGEVIDLPGSTIVPVVSAAGIGLILVGATTSIALSIAGAMLLACTARAWIRG